MKSDFFSFFSFSFSFETIIPGSQVQFSVVGKIAQCFQDSPLHMEGASMETPYRFSLCYMVGEGLFGSEAGLTRRAQPHRVLRTAAPSKSGSHLVSVLWSLTVSYSGLPAFFLFKIVFL